MRPRRGHLFLRLDRRGSHYGDYPRRRLRSQLPEDSVRVPDGEDPDEWLALMTVDLFNELKLLHGIIEDLCTSDSCPKMCAGPKYEYRWTVGEQVSAARYVELLFSWVEAQLDDPALFPTQFGMQFPRDFRASVRTIFKRLFRVYAHMYYNHFERMGERGFEPHLNSCFKNFMLFVLEHDLIPERAQLQPLAPLVSRLCPDSWREYRQRQVTLRWTRLRRLAFTVGGFSAVLLALHNEVHFRPGHGGAEWAREHFSAAAAAAAELVVARSAEEQRCHECEQDAPSNVGSHGLADTRSD